MNSFSFRGMQIASEMADSSTDISRNSSGISRVRQEIRMLEANLAKSLMINEALWELMRDRMGITEEQFNEKLYEIDMRDGVLDGKNQRSDVQKCPKCNRPVSARHSACIYCGEVLDESVFSMT